MADNENSSTFEGISISIVFGIFFGLAAHLYDLTTIRIDLFFTGFFWGGFLGFASLPSIDANRWRSRPVMCAIFASLGGVAFVSLLGWPSWAYPALGSIGLVIGYFSPFWITRI